MGYYYYYSLVMNYLFSLTRHFFPLRKIVEQIVYLGSDSSTEFLKSDDEDDDDEDTLYVLFLPFCLFCLCKIVYYSIL